MMYCFSTLLSFSENWLTDVHNIVSDPYHHKLWIITDKERKQTTQSLYVAPLEVIRSGWELSIMVFPDNKNHFSYQTFDI